MASPSLRQLDIFAQLLASGSFRRCAQELGIATETVEREIASLELRLGYGLFDWDGDRARPTAAGLKTARALTLLSDDVPPPVPQPAPDPVRQTIVLAAPAPVFGHFREALAAFEAANEDIAITLDLTVHVATDAAAAFARGTADIAYFYALEEPDDPPARYGWSEQFNLYVGEDHVLGRSDGASLGEVARAPMLAMEARSGLRRISDAALARGGIMASAPLLETDNMVDILTALRMGEGIFPAFGPLARDLGRMGGIRRVTLERPLPSIGIWQAVREAAKGRLAVGALAEFLFL